MKPWLLEILACPIDKHYPLAVTVFTWENEAAFFETELQVFRAREHLGEEIVQITEEGDRVTVADELIRAPTPAAAYLGELLDKIDELDPISDLSGGDAPVILDLLRTEVRATLEHTWDEVKNITDAGKIRSALEAVLPELVLLNKYKLWAEVEEGLFTCTECDRWYPILETIPQMLPDKLRSKKDDVAFLAKWAEKLPDGVKGSGQPWTIED